MRTENGLPDISVHLPLTVLALAIAVFLGAQIMSVKRSGQTMTWQLSNLDKQNANLKDAQKNFADLIKKREETVNHSLQIQKQYTALFNEVLELSKDDADAKTVVQKWGIQRQANQESGAAPASAAPASAEGNTTGPATPAPK
jgi:septal ring factor EnvC (AmiA/AmiB activator)